MRAPWLTPAQREALEEVYAWIADHDAQALPTDKDLPDTNPFALCSLQAKGYVDWDDDYRIRPLLTEEGEPCIPEDVTALRAAGKDNH